MKTIINLIATFFIMAPCFSQLSSIPPKTQLPDDKNWKLVWSDEFNGKVLDTTKWGFRQHIMQTRHETWTDDAYEIDGEGNLLLKAYEKNGEYYTSQLQTGSNFMDRPGDPYGKSKLTWPIANLETSKFLHKYGYYEIRCKLPTQEGWWVAFWLQSPTIGASLDPLASGVEIDIMENFKRDGTIRQNIHWNGYGKNHEHEGSGDIKLGLNDNAFHTYGVDWSPTGYVFYIDGKETWRVAGPVSHQEQFILVSAECNGYRNGAASSILKEAKLPDYFVVDYIRVYDEINY
ncbi:glycoside hydrolase family 16 protein [Kriegella aquimaris]|uniref:Beta-glucanase, GH16 family n=1 Tax=Kriegella aquimaris TaxID=192904 RepID=A0A1G9TNG9_9FLAO|nr:glycoside hydrolase family 16 protein [Kriegella aquimaris]SDM49182.1 Beta-glucanase, GH16 family [Kriegella aquimaris]